MFLNLLFERPETWALHVAVVIVSVVLHELGHALCATWQGDPTPAIRGHLTWNPVVHMGWLSLGLLAAFGIAFGLTPVTPAKFRNRRWGETLVSLAGPAVNLLLCVVSAATLAVVALLGGGDSFAVTVWGTVLHLNAVLFLLNLIPLPPLDGFQALEGAVDLGGLGSMLRSLGWYPMILAFFLANTPAFGTAVEHLAVGLVKLFMLPFVQ